MDLIKKEYADKTVEAELTPFHLEDWGSVSPSLLTLKWPAMPFVAEVRNIQQAY